VLRRCLALLEHLLRHRHRLVGGLDAELGRERDLAARAALLEDLVEVVGEALACNRELAEDDALRLGRLVRRDRVRRDGRRLRDGNGERVGLVRPGGRILLLDLRLERGGGVLRHDRAREVREDLLPRRVERAREVTPEEARAAVPEAVEVRHLGGLGGGVGVGGWGGVGVGEAECEDGGE
jgi:hypothetical protein